MDPALAGAALAGAAALILLIRYGRRSQPDIALAPVPARHPRPTRRQPRA